MSKTVQTPINIDLPVGSRLGWELDNTLENDQLRSVAESAILVRSLRQSRERWLLSTFPKFSSKSRSTKLSEPPPTPPPHTIQTRGRCDVEIGPHVFSDTAFYEVHYLPPQPLTPFSSSSNTRPYQTSWQTTTPYGASYLYSALPASHQSTGLTSSLDLSTITPALINQVNSAASSNPILANLLQLAAAGTATQDQLKTLGLLIQSLASRESAAMASSAAAQQQQASALHSSLLVSRPPVKPFDVVIEFRELPNERWLFPRGPAVCESVPDNSGSDVAYDTLITTCIPFKKADEPPPPESSEQATNETPKQPEKPPRVVKIRLKKAPLVVWDTLYRWVGGEQEIRKHQEYLQSLKPPERIYLGYQLLPGSLLSQLQAVSTNIYPMKFIKPGQYSSRSSKKRPAARRAVEQPSKASDETPTKQRRRSRITKRASAQILCQACGSTDVPLIRGGRYCRPCVDSGKANASDTRPATPTAAPSQAPTNVVTTKSPVFIHSNYSSQVQS